MLKTRVIVTLLLDRGQLVKTVRFGEKTYIGDPINAVRIYNDFEVDEMVFLDIRASVEAEPIHYDLLQQITDECFMPLAYGGGIVSLDQMKRIFSLGFEKVITNTAVLRDPDLIDQACGCFGSQSVVVSIDVKRGGFGRRRIFNRSLGRTVRKTPLDWAREVEARGAGEILLTSVDREGTWSGYDLELTREIASAVGVPVIACGGAADVTDFGRAVREGGASAVAAGSMFVFQKKGMGVLINLPRRDVIDAALVDESAGRRRGRE